MAKYSDIQLIQFIQKAARQVNRELCLKGTVDVIVVDNSGNITSPDDESLRDLVMMQAECLIAQRELSEDLKDGTGGLLVRDGEQTIDTRLRATSQADFMSSEHGPCARVKEALRVEKIKRSCGRLIY